MLDPDFLNDLSSKLKIDKERIAREFYEILTLYNISQQPWSKYLIFKGGTALRLAYNSPRFSDDIDFSMTRKVKSSLLFEFAEKFANEMNIQISDMWEKRNTMLVEFKISEPAIPQPFRLKIEISKRITKIKYQLKLITSPTSNLQVLINTAEIESILNEKIQALKERAQPRDLFDIWYISQIEKMDFKKLLKNFELLKVIKKITSEDPSWSAKTIKQTLRKYLPLNWYKAIDEITKIIEELK